MKRVGSPPVAEGQTETPATDGPPPPKRTKASKACLGCRHQKTRCDPGITTTEGGMRCKRCAHFNLRCSLEGSPPRPKATILPSISDSFPRVPSPPPPPTPPQPHAPGGNTNSGLPPQHSRRSSPPRNLGPNTLRGPSPPPSSAPPNISSTRDRQYGSDAGGGVPSPGQQQFPPPRSEYPLAPPIQHVQAQQPQQYPSSSSRYNNGSRYREPLGPPPPNSASSNASSYYSNRSHTPQQQHYQSGSGQPHQPHHYQHHHPPPPPSQPPGSNYHHQNTASSTTITTGAWTPKGISVSPHTSAPVPPVPAPGPSPRSSAASMGGSRGGTPRVPNAYIMRTDSGGGGMGPGGLGEEPPPGSSGHSGSGSGGAMHCYQPPARPLAPPSPPLNFDQRSRKAPIDIVATASVSLSNDKPAAFKEWGGPLSFVRELLTPTTPAPDAKTKDLVSAGIVSLEDAQVLSRIFMARFAPWLATIDTRSQLPRSTPSYTSTSKDEKPYQPATSAFLQAAQWTIAARHLPTPSDPVKERAHDALRKRLAKVLESLSFRALLGLDNTLPTLRALIILATWTGKLPTRSGNFADFGLGAPYTSGIGAVKPNANSGNRSDNEGGTRAEAANPNPIDGNTAANGEDGEEEAWDMAKEGIAYDGEMFLGAAMRIAAKMHLELDVQMVLAHKQTQEQEQRGSPNTNSSGNAIASMSPAKVAEALDRCRVLYTLSVLDVFANIGKGRLCSPRVPFHLAEQIFGAPATLATKPGGSADARLVFQCSLLDIALRALDLCTSDQEVYALGAERWVNRVQHELKAFNHWQHKLAPVVALTDPNEMVQVTTVTLQFHFLKLLVLFRSFRTVRRTFPHLVPILASANRGDFHEKGGYSPPGLGRPHPMPTPLSPVLRAQQSVNAAGVELETDQLVGDAAVDWIRLSRECSETIMIESLTLRRLFMNDEPAIPGEKILPALAYVPDHMLYALFFGPIYTVKAHLLTITILRIFSPRHETTRSLLDRTIDMFREAVPKDQDAEKRAKILEERLRAASYLEIITQDGVQTIPQPLPPTKEEKSSPPREEKPEDNKNDDEMMGKASVPQPESERTAFALAASSSNALSPAPAPAPPAPAPSTSLVGRCADVLTALIKLWDARTAEWHANEAAGLHKRRQPSAFSKDSSSSNSNGHGHHQNSLKEPHSGAQGDEEEDELASDNGDAPAPGQTHRHSPMSHGGSSGPSGPGSRPAITHTTTHNRSLTPTGNSPSGNNLPSVPGASAQLMGSGKPLSDGPLPQWQTGPTELLGTQLNFDLESFWDGSFFDPMFMFDMSANLHPAFAQAGYGGAYTS